MEDRERFIHDTVEAVVAQVYRSISNPKFTAAESRLARLQVIAKLLTSVVIDQQGEVMVETLRKVATPEELRLAFGSDVEVKP